MAFTAYKGDFDNVTYILPLDLAPYFSQVRVKSILHYASSAPGGMGELMGVTSLSAVEDFDPRLGTARVTFLEGGEEDFAAADGEYLTLLDHDDLLYPNALFEVVQTIQNTGACWRIPWRTGGGGPFP